LAQAQVSGTSRDGTTWGSKLGLFVAGGGTHGGERGNEKGDLKCDEGKEHKLTKSQKGWGLGRDSRSPVKIYLGGGEKSLIAGGSTIMDLGEQSLLVGNWKNWHRPRLSQRRPTVRTAVVGKTVNPRRKFR